MIADRRIFHAKQGSAPRLVELLKGAIEGNTVYTKSYRIYTQNIGPYDEVVVEWEYDNLQEMEAAWDVWRANTDLAAFWAKWHELTERGGHGEIWSIAAHR